MSSDMRSVPDRKSNWEGKDVCFSFMVWLPKCWVRQTQYVLFRNYSLNLLGCY